MFKKPTLLIDHKKVEMNINRMLQKAIKSNVVFRPHFKTHQSAEVGKIFRQNHIEKITVSSVSMASFFADSGWNDITIALSVNLREIDEIDQLSKKNKINLLIESDFTADFLAKHLKNKTGIFIKIDVGYHRTGLLPENIPGIEKIIRIISNSEMLEMKGFLTHAGHTYHAKSRAEILSIMQDAKLKLQSLKHYFASSLPNLIISYGDTPSCSLAENFDGFDEVRPGNFVYFDVMQHRLGSCSLDEIAVAVACPIAAVHPERSELVIYGGAVHFSKERLVTDNKHDLFGYIVHITKNGWSEIIPGAYVSALSQEHGIIRMPANLIRHFKPGELIGILPVHSCLTVDCLRDSQVII